MNLDIGRAFTFFNEDPKGMNKILIGGGLAIATFLALFTVIGWIPLALILIGYGVQLTRNVIAGQQYPLPEWDNWGERLVDGFKGWLVGFVYSLPAAILQGIFTVPQYINQVRTAMGDTTSDGAAIATSGLSSIGGCLAWIVGIIFSMFSAAAIGRYAATNSLGEAFQFGAVFNLFRQNIGNYVVIALFAGIVLNFIAALGLIAFCIGVFFTIFYSQVVLYHLYGQAYRSAAGVSMQPAYDNPYSGGQRPF
jgi:hypothetical protein